MSQRQPRLDFEGLYRSHRQEVYRVALRKLGDHHEAEDVTQSDLPRRLPRRPPRKRARLAARLAARDRGERSPPPLPRGAPPSREEQLLESHAAGDAVTVSADEIREALATLAESQRKAFLLSELGGLSHREIASELGTTVAAVQMLVFRARQKLRRELGAHTPSRLGGLVSLPHWLASLVERLSPAGSGAARVVGLAAAAAVAVGGGITTDAPATPRDRTPPVLSAVSPAAATKPPSTAASTAGATVPDRSPALVAPAVVATRIQTHASARGAEPGAQPEAAAPGDGSAAEPVVVPVSGAEPVAPAASPATTEGGNGAPTPALVPALPPVGPPALPVAVRSPSRSKRRPLHRCPTCRWREPFPRFPVCRSWSRRSSRRLRAVPGSRPPRSRSRFPHGFRERERAAPDIDVEAG